MEGGWQLFLSNLRLHLLRSVLTSLGIILGVGAVIVMVSIGEGNKQAALREIQALGAFDRDERSTAMDLLGFARQLVFATHSVKPIFAPDDSMAPPACATARPGPTTARWPSSVPMTID